MLFVVNVAVGLPFPDATAVVLGFFAFLLFVTIYTYWLGKFTMISNSCLVY